MRCWKCGTVCDNHPQIGLFCPARGCDVVDGVGLSPEEFEHGEKQGRAFTFIPAVGPPVRFDRDGKRIREEKMSELSRPLFEGFDP
jgi:hypothetical protein